MQDFRSDYEIIKEIDKRDGLRSVFLCKLRKDQRLVVLKKVFFSDYSELNRKSREYLSMLEFKHPFISKVLGVSINSVPNQNESSLDIFFEYFPEGNLITLINNRNSYPWTDFQIVKMFKNLVDAHSSLQNNSIAHRDIKPQNILVTGSGTILKVTDFGEAERIESFNNLKIAGTPAYFSPELHSAHNSMSVTVSHNPYKSDVFSLGLVMIQMLTLSQHPVKTLKERRVFRKIRKLSETYPISCMILEKMMPFDQAKRFDFKELKQFFDMIYECKYSFACDGCKVKRFPEEFYVFSTEAMCKICVDNLQTYPLVPGFQCFCHTCQEILDPSFECSCMTRCMTCKARHQSDLCCIDVLTQLNNLSFNFTLICCCGRYTDKFMHDCVLSCTSCDNLYCIVCLKRFQENDHGICHFVLRNRFKL